MGGVALLARNLGKRFGATVALADMSFEVRTGEIHALAGENGAGKSTLVNILSGVFAPDTGALFIDGRETAFTSPRAARAAGVATVHQELSLAENLTIAENLFAGRLPSRLGVLDRARLMRDARAAFARLGVDVNPSAHAGDLPVSSRQIAEIAKALTLDARIILLDEPTSALNTDEKRALFALLRRVSAEGVGVLYISHHMDEVMTLSNRVSVLRDGRLIATHSTSGVRSEQIVREMVGRDVGPPAAATSTRSNRARLVLEGGARRGEFEGVSLRIGEGEIVAIAGLMGSGRSELAAALAGLRPLHAGQATLDGAPYRPASFAAAKRLGIGYVPAERKTEGLFLDLAIDVNVAAASLPRVSRFGLFRPEAARAMALRSIDALSIRASDVCQPCGSLSGGNQQKVLLAKWLETGPRLLIVEEPTKGVDVVAKAEIHRKIVELASSGVSVLFVSSDLPETLTLAHRVLVMHRGAVVADLDATEATEARVTALAAGLERDAA